MKHRFLILTLLTALLVPLSLRAEWSDDLSSYYMRSADGYDKAVKATESFYLSTKEGSRYTSRDCGVSFTPAAEGQLLTITLEECELSSDSYILVYDGIQEKMGAAGLSDGTSQSRYFAEGWVLKLTPADIGKVYTTSSADGALSIGLHTSFTSSPAPSFKIKVESIVPTDMEFDSVTSAGDLPRLRRGGKDQVVASFDVVTKGIKNALSIESMLVSVNDNEKAANYRLVSKGKVIASASGNSVEMKTPAVLSPGHNVFEIIADIAADVAGEIMSPTLSSVIVDGQERGPVEASDIQVANVIYMPEGNTTFTIDDEVRFYDDGGPDKTIGSNFKGSVTFVPATEGSAVKIDFEKLELFNTSNTGMNDIFKFYNGRVADENNLITTLLTEPRIVKSTAADGSLTVTLTSTTGYPKNGWEAVVSQFVPGPMTVSGVTLSTPSADSPTVSAGDKKVTAFIVDVITDNTGDQLSLDDIAVTTTSQAMVSAVSVFSLGDRPDADKGTHVASAASSPSMTLPVGVALLEGHNYFMITADIAEAAVNDKVIDLTVDRVNVSRSNVELSGTRQMNFKVRNVCRSTEGKHTHDLYDRWEFLPTMSGTKYASGTTDQTVTFRPVSPGHVAQILFNDFHVYYSSSSYGSKALFKIYSGTSCDESKLIWSLDSNAKQDAGPDGVIRSDADDGALTVRFNPNASYSSYCLSGWSAVVSEFKNHDMTVTGTAVRQSSAGDVAVSATGVPVLDFTIETEGTLTTKCVGKVNLKIDGADAVSRVAVYCSQSDNRKSATLFGEAEVNSENVTVAGSFTMKEGANFMWVEADITSDAEPETVVDFTLVSLTDSGDVTETVSDGNPSGSHTVKLMIIESAGRHLVEVTRPVMFYDDGGVDGKIGSVIGTSKTAVYTFVPVGENKAVKIDAKSFSIGNGRMYFYSGREADDNNMLGNQTGYSATSGPKEPLISKAADGSMTVSIKNPTGTTLDGFAIEVSLHEKQPFLLGGVVTSKPMVSDEIVRGAVEVPLTRVAVSVDGDKGDCQIGSMTFDLTDATASRASLYYGGSCDNFNIYGSTLLSSGVPVDGKVTLSASNSTEGNGTRYYYLVVDVDHTSAAGDEVSARLTAMTFNETEQRFSDLEQQRLTVREGLAGGTYSVGSGGTYATIEEAAQALRNGIEGAVTLEILDGTYKEYLIINDIQGTSEKSPLTVRSASGNRDAVVLKPVYDSVDGDFVVRVDHTPWVTVSGISVDATGQSNFKGLVLTNDRSHDFTLDNCVLTADRPSGYSGAALFQSYNSTLETQLGTLYGTNSRNGFNSDNFTLTGNVFNGGKDGAYLSGCGIVANLRHKGAVVRGNTFNNVKGMSVYVNNVDELTIADNIVNIGRITDNNSKGIDINGSRNFSLTGNKIAITPSAATYYSTALNIRSSSGGYDGRRSLVANNDIVITKNKQYGYALQIDNSSRDIDIVFNTVRMGGDAGYLVGVSGSGVASGMVLADNLLQSEVTAVSSGADVIYFSSDESVAGYKVDHNVVYAANRQLVKINSEHLTDITEMNSRLGDVDATNVVEQASFADVTNQHLADKGVSLCIARPFETVKTDRDGIARPADNATVGAYEFVGLSDEKPAVAEGYPVVANIDETSADVRTKWTVSGTLYAKTVRWSETSQTPSVGELLESEKTSADENTEVVTSVKNLDADTDYRTFFMMVSVTGVESGIVSTETYRTLRHIDPLAVVTGDRLKINAGNEATLTAVVTGGDAPYTFDWRDQMNVPFSTEQSPVVTPEHTQAYSVTVTSADGQTAKAEAVVAVLGDFVAATADDNYIETDRVIDPKHVEGALYSGSLAFNGATMSYGNYSYWNGYAFSAMTSNLFSSIDDQYNSAPGGGVSGSNFIVAYPGGYTIDVTNSIEGEIIAGLCYTNNAYALSSMTLGDGFSKKFGQGDWFKCTVEGVHADGTTASVDIYLADFRGADEADRYVVDRWEWADLRSLGKVTSLRFTFDSTDKTAGYLNTPTYICLDNVGMMPEAETRKVTVAYGEDIDLTPLFDNNRGATVTYALVDGDNSVLSIDGDRLSIDTGDDKEEMMLTALVRRTEAGHSEFVCLEITRSAFSDVDFVDVAADIRLYPVPVVDRLNIATSLEGYSVEIYSADGSLVIRQTDLDRHASVDCQSVAPGVYIVRIIDRDGVVTHTRRIVIRS